MSVKRMFIFSTDNQPGWKWTVFWLLKRPIRQHLRYHHLFRSLCRYDHLSPADPLQVLLPVPHAVPAEQHWTRRVSVLGGTWDHPMHVELNALRYIAELLLIKQIRSEPCHQRQQWHIHQHPQYGTIRSKYLLLCLESNRVFYTFYNIMYLMFHEQG